MDKFASFTCMFFMYLFMAVSVFAPVHFHALPFYPGLLLVIGGVLMHLSAKRAYTKTAPDKPAINGIYRFSRNPMYVSFSLILLGTAVAAFSPVLFVLWLLTAGFTHRLVIGEERYCLNTYGESYREYLNNTPRYLLLP